MNQPRVLLMPSNERTSAKGRPCTSYRLGKASVVAFQADEPDKHGNPVWQVFVAEPPPRPDQRSPPLERPAPPAGGTPEEQPAGRRLVRQPPRPAADRAPAAPSSVAAATACRLEVPSLVMAWSFA